MNLFETGNFTLHSGQQVNWKIDCDALTDDDIETLAVLVKDLVGPYCSVEGVPTGGLRLAEALGKYTLGHGPTLIVDDVCTTGASMENQRGDRSPTDVVGCVLFLRGSMPRWCHALFIMNGVLR